MNSIISSEVVSTFHDQSDAYDPEAGSEAELRKVTLSAKAHGLRLDLALAEVVPEFSRSYLQQLMADRAVMLDGLVVTKPSHKAKAGQEVAVEMKPTQESRAFLPERMQLEVVFEDAHLLVLNKPAGLVVHPAPGNWCGTLLNGLLARYPDAAHLPRAGIVHRLDKDTSGLMVVARTRASMDQLTRMIASRLVSREYIALAHHPWRGSKSIQVDAALGRDPKNRLRMAVVDLRKNSGKPANTTVTLLDNVEGSQGYCLVKCILGTGRTHQIRVHMAFLKHPLVADLIYGGASAGDLHRQALHAHRLSFEHPISGNSLDFYLAPPEDFLRAQCAIGLRYNYE
jgi:23S rRNA pseudouridine1911/1915/1917 synthase